ncbi:hypothetical protein KV205_05400 [Streptomyces sp. SKN60]|uniref:hypothetical protein n=1 Tax=Streptomyces sp. SKN60 TaxID=2855506 RepID=UPI0022468A67|nr:hypothetical protein [Streptomyces sp. SKN60]MCX2179968.1 hypothetical protein [Streptomyces sp. SKN60]
MRQDGRRGRQGCVNGGGGLAGKRFPRLVRQSALFCQELTMADVAFVVTTVAIFALVAFVARGVAKL